MERMKELIVLLNKAAYAYYQEDKEIMSDHEYDKLYDELLQLEKETNTILANSPTQKVGYTVLSNLKKIKHDVPILSLDKTKEVEKLKEFLKEQKGILSWKLDGLTIVLTYQQGELVQAVTRGNGSIGEDVTHNAKVFQNIPLKIPYKEELVIRGEGIITLSEFKKINNFLQQGESYKNPRNLCSGSVRQLNSEIAAKRNILFYAFTLAKADNIDFNDSKLSQMDWLKKIGFTVVEHNEVTVDTIENAVQNFQKNVVQNDFASDGLVLTYDSISYSDSLGTTSKFPKDSIAFKWADEMAETTLLNVIWNTSRTGLMNPIAVFEPVELEGSTVSRASVHNVSILEELQLGIGDKIKVYKANMIIPQIAENLTKQNNIEIPKQCFVCGGETEIRTLKDGKALYCTNPNCQAQQIRSLSHFVSRDAMNIEGLSEETLKKFVEKEFVKNYTDIFNLEQYQNDIENMEGFGKRSYQKLIDSIQKAKEVPLAHFIYALGINHVGLSNAKLLCKNFKYDLEEIQKAAEEDIVAIDGFGEIIAHSIYQYFHNEKDMELLQKVLQYITFIPPEITEDTEKLHLNGMSFVITGDLEQFENRKELQKKIEHFGGKVTGSVTKKTVCLINNDTTSNSSKNKKAKELDIPILNEYEFIEKYMKEM